MGSRATRPLGGPLEEPKGCENQISGPFQKKSGAFPKKPFQKLSFQLLWQSGMVLARISMKNYLGINHQSPNRIAKKLLYKRFKLLKIFPKTFSIFHYLLSMGQS